MKIPNIDRKLVEAFISLARIVSEDSQHGGCYQQDGIKSSKDS